MLRSSLIEWRLPAKLIHLIVLTCQIVQPSTTKQRKLIPTTVKPISLTILLSISNLSISIAINRINAKNYAESLFQNCNNDHFSTNQSLGIGFFSNQQIKFLILSKNNRKVRAKNNQIISNSRVQSNPY